MLKDKVLSGEACVGVMGLGYVGLPLAVEAARAGFSVKGFDIDVDKVSLINSGKYLLEDLDSEEFRRLVVLQKIEALSDFADLAECDVIFVCVPTPLTETKEPDISAIVRASEEIGRRLRIGQLVVLESTTYPGTTEEVVLPILSQTGLLVGEDFYLAYSPERVDPGNKEFGIRNTPRIVGGVTSECAENAKTFYEQIVSKVKLVSSVKVAETTKLLENIFRGVNIALVNELMMLCDRMKINIWEVIEAASTKPFGYMPFYPGPGMGGHCLDGGEYIFLRNGHGLEVLQAKQCFERLTRKEKTRSLRVGGLEVIKPEATEILSFDLTSRKSNYKPLQYLFRRAYEGRMIEIHTDDGRRLKVTDQHPMVVLDGAQLVTRNAVDLESGDSLVISKSIPGATEDNFTIDLIDQLDEKELRNVRVRPRHQQFSAHKNQLRPHLKHYKNYGDIFRHNSMPLHLYLSLEKANVMPVSRADIYLCTGSGSSWNRIPALMSIDEEFARLTGYYLSEGCLTEDGSLRVRFTFGSDEKEYIADLEGILRQKDLRYSTHKSKQWNAYHIKISSRLFGALVRDVLGCGTNCYNMSIPSLFLTASERLRRSLLAGLLRGDGDVHHANRERSYVKRGRTYRHNFNTATAGFFSSSPQLFQQVVILLQSLNFVPTFKKNKPQLRLYGADQLARLEPFFAGKKLAKLEKYRQKRSKRMPNKKSVDHGTFAAVKVKQIVRSKANTVYSVEVEDTHTFTTSYGIVTHNCIPIDPFYLSWKAREYDFHTEFIELAGKINENVPYYVAQKISDALNDQQKSINGSRILIIGVAYKKNVADTRSSPALKIIELLSERKAIVSYHDPLVETIEVRDMGYHSQPLTKEEIANSDCVVIMTNHDIINYEMIVQNAVSVVDTRNALAMFSAKHILKI